MIQKLVHSFLLRRHFWRYATFSEVSELYISRILRMAAMHMASVFISIFLYQTGYSLIFIALFWAAFVLFKMIMSLPIAAFIGWIGPKHAIFISNLMYIPAMLAFALLPILGPWVLVVVLVFEGISNAMYSIAYSVDFSKVKSAEHAGKEIAYMNIFEKVTAGLSPLIGGLIALVFGPQVVMVLAAVFFAIAAVPLMKTGEQVKTRQKLQLRGFPWHLIRSHAFAQMSIGYDLFTSGTVWSLFTAIIILGVGTGNDVYAMSGLLLSGVFFSAIAASYIYGKLIDRKKGGELLRISVIVDSLVHIVRPFADNPITAAAVNAANEVATTGYAMPYTRGLFDNADLSGRRITYMGLVEILSNFGILIAALLFAFLVMLIGETKALSNFFFFSAIFVLLILTARFALYRKR